MKIQDKLAELGFEFVTSETVNDDWRSIFYKEYFAENRWLLPIKGGRRGQQYYLIWEEKNPTQLLIDFTKPDGDGCEAILPLSIVIELAPFLGVQTTNETIIEAGNACVDQLRDLSSGGQHLECISEWLHVTGQGE